MGGLCSGKPVESEIDLEKAKYEKNLLAQAENPRDIDDLESEFANIRKNIEFPSQAVKVFFLSISYFFFRKNLTHSPLLNMNVKLIYLSL